FFDSSVRCFRAMLAPLEALASPRASVEAYSSIARFALVLGSVPEAEKAVELCEAAAQRSGLWRHQVTALVTRAEIHLCKGQLELRLFNEAAAHIAGDKIEGGAPALEDAVTTGLLGPLARLLAVGVHHPAVPQRQGGVCRRARCPGLSAPSACRGPALGWAARD